MRVAIVGSQGYSDLWRVVVYVRRLPIGTMVISGAAKGLDETVAKAARLCGLEVIEYVPNWDKYGESAGRMRNEQIIDHCDRLVAFWDGTSKDTLDIINKAKAADKEVEVISPQNGFVLSH